MEAGFSVPIHNDSEQYIKDTLSHYVEVDQMPFIDNPIVHIYAKEDTFNEYGELNGYVDSLFCEYHFYDTKNSTVYKSKRLHDALFFGDGVNVSNVKLFKDGSTLIQLRSGRYEISGGMAIHLELY